MATSKIQPSTTHLTSADTLLDVNTTGGSFALANSIRNYLLCEVLIIDSSGKCLNSVIVPTERILDTNGNGVDGIYPSYYSDSQIVRYVTFSGVQEVGISAGGGNGIRVIIYGLFKHIS